MCICMSEQKASSYRDNAPIVRNNCKIHHNVLFFPHNVQEKIKKNTHTIRLVHKKKSLHYSQSVHIHCRYSILVHLFHTPFSVSHPLLSFSVSLLLSPTNSPIYHSLSYPPHRLNSLKWKERKGRKEAEREKGG